MARVAATGGAGFRKVRSRREHAITWRHPAWFLPLGRCPTEGLSHFLKETPLRRSRVTAFRDVAAKGGDQGRVRSTVLQQGQGDYARSNKPFEGVIKRSRVIFAHSKVSGDRAQKESQ